MTDPTEQPTPKRFLSHAFIPALGVCVLAAAALLYVTIGSGGKETAEAKACAANAAQRAAVDRAAKGEVAALAIAKEFEAGNAARLQRPGRSAGNARRL